jgi:Domain of unknown function (DUF3885)
MISKKEILDIFGNKALGNALFYSQEGGLRFELSGNKTYIDMFCRAMDRSREILKFLFAEKEKLTFVLSYFGSTDFIKERKVFRSIRNCGITLPRPIEVSSCIEEDSQQRVFIVFEANKGILQQLLWGVFARELGIRPRLWCQVFIISPELGLLVHPYDDRGMDIIGHNKFLLKHLFIEFNHYLLDYDRKRMESFFNSF